MVKILLPSLGVVVLLSFQLLAQTNKKPFSDFICCPEKNETIWVDQYSFRNLILVTTSSKPAPLDGFSDPLLSYLNFDDVSWNGTAIPIAPNRYAGVSFYGPFSNSNTFVRGNFGSSYSFPNHLLVGSVTSGGAVRTQSPIVVNFAQKMQDVAFYVYLGGCQSAAIDIYENQAFSQRVYVGVLASDFTRVDLNSYSRKITNLRINYNCALQPTENPYVIIDDVYFQYNPYNSPVGNLDPVSLQDAAAVGWSLDPDSESASNSVHCYIDGNFAGVTTANLPRPGLPYSGNHGFSFQIPTQYRDGSQHSINCYGIDVTGGDSPTLLTGSPRTFKFNIPIGFFDGINGQGTAVGWSLDPDVPLQSNVIHFYIDGAAGSGGVYIGGVLADLPRPDVNQQTGYPGNHGYNFSIPSQYRDNRNHTLYVYGLDLTGDNPKHLVGSPKTFNLSPVVVSTQFVSLPQSPLTLNNNPGGGLRIFPESSSPGGPVNNTVNVKAQISATVAGIPIYFRAFDLDDPSANASPLDDENNFRDNRSDAQIGDLCPAGSSGCEFDAPSSGFKVLTNGNGEAIIPFRLTGAHPGDNYGIVASTSPAETAQASVNGVALSNSFTSGVFQIGVDRTPMLTAWRTLHIERDSMGPVTQNFVDNEVNSTTEILVGPQQVDVPLLSSVDAGRFQNGRLFFYEDQVFVHSNLSQTVTVSRIDNNVSLQPFYNIRLFDDDDFNSDSGTGGFDADNGEDIDWLPDSFDLLQENDDRDCSDKLCNVFAGAYISPKFAAVSQYNQSNISFNLNTPNAAKAIGNQIALGAHPDSIESDSFWVAYVQIAYQYAKEFDCDPNEESGCTYAATPGTIFARNDVANSSEVPLGARGSLIFIETTRDVNNQLTMPRISAIPHEIGHQFGILGDFSESPANFGIMGYNGGLTFIDRHLNVIRWRRKSPGIE